MAAKKSKKKSMGIVASERYTLFYGDVLSFDPVKKVAVVAECRQVCRWFGKTGGITSLAAHGLCGPKASESNIGAPTTDPATLTGIVNVFPCSAEAVATFAAAVAK